MKKGTLILIVILLMVVGYSAYNTTVNLYGKTKIADNISDFKVYISSLKVNGNEVSGINGSKDGFVIDTPVTGTIEYEITNDSTEYDTEASLECENSYKSNYEYDYTGNEQIFIAPTTGMYKLETWGAQGGNAGSTYHGGYGGYSKGKINLTKNQKVYINVGGMGKSCSTASRCEGGYNGGGNALAYTEASSQAAGGGGATHIATTTGLLSTFENTKSSVIIVSGGGGGGHYTNNVNGGIGGSAGGYVGSSPTSLLQDYNVSGRLSNPGTQTSAGCSSIQADCGSFGLGGSSAYTNYHAGAGSGGGAGYYGGSGANINAGAGGSSYIGNVLLVNKSMYCYDCSESSDTQTNTISTSCVNSTPTENCSKSGNGYARITLDLSTKKELSENIRVSANSIKRNTLKDLNVSSLSCKLKTNKISRNSVETTFNVITGTGFNIGDEVCFGKECFYVYNYDGENIKMLSKYNLKVGRNLLSSSNIVNIETSSSGYGYQDRTMLGGAYTDKVEYPVNGEVFYSDSTNKGNKYNSYKGSIIEKYVKLYKENLNKIGLSLSESQVRLITKEEIDKLYNKNLSDVFIKDNSGDYPWIYSTSYWTMSECENTNDEIYVIRSDSRLSKHKYNYQYRGVRPVIVVPVKEFISSIKNAWNIDYSQKEVEFIAPETGTYKLETWGAQGGNSGSIYYGGYGAYSTGEINLTRNQKLYINVGGIGEKCSSTASCEGGYNGGGNALAYTQAESLAAGGGGATHIATTSGLLSTLENQKSSIIMVAGGGGGGHYTNSSNGGIGGSAGGYIGSSATDLLKDYIAPGRLSNPGTQTSAGCNSDKTDCGSFGIGGSSSYTKYHDGAGSGGGAGYYGGSGANINAGSGGSGYIGNTLLTNKAMYCYNCATSNEISTKTISTTCTSSTPTENCSKQGNGYARITLISID